MVDKFNNSHDDELHPRLRAFLFFHIDTGSSYQRYYRSMSVHVITDRVKGNGRSTFASPLAEIIKGEQS